MDHDNRSPPLTFRTYQILPVPEKVDKFEYVFLTCCGGACARARQAWS